MLLLIALILAFGFVFLCGKPLKKYPCIFYASAVVITIASVVISGSDMRSVPVFLNTYIIGLFTRGAFATALWCVVMWAGAFPNGSVLIKKIMPIRGELSIFAAILTLGHNIGFGQTYFVRLFTSPERMSGNQIAAGILSIVMLIIMIPLTIISFPKIRKKMNPKLWKRIQRTAYVFYALLYIHVMLLYYPFAKAGRDGYLLGIFVYSAVFIGYAVCRVRKWYVMRKKPKNVMPANIICAVIFIVLAIGVTLCARSDKPKADADINEIQAEHTLTVTSEVSSSLKSTTVSVNNTSSTNTNAVTETKTTTTSVTDDADEETEVSDEILEEDEQSEDDFDDQEIYEDPDEYYEPENPNPIPNSEPSYIYNNGTYSASAYGYDGEVHVTITIENDIITSISGYTDESDPWYYESAQGSVIPQILASQSTMVDAYSGATYSSNAIMSAVQSALNSAKN